jgi:hypothetical protein
MAPSVTCCYCHCLMSMFLQRPRRYRSSRRCRVYAWKTIWSLAVSRSIKQALQTSEWLSSTMSLVSGLCNASWRDMWSWHVEVVEVCAGRRRQKVTPRSRPPGCTPKTAPLSQDPRVSPRSSHQCSTIRTRWHCSRSSEVTSNMPLKRLIMPHGPNSWWLVFRGILGIGRGRPQPQPT